MNSSDLRLARLPKRWFLASLALLPIEAALVLADERAPAPALGLEPDEQLVLRNAAADEPKAFDKEKLGILRSTFLQQLLTGRLKEAQDAHYIGIQYAHIVGDFKFCNSEVKPYVSLQDCTFDGEVDFSWCFFAKGLNLSGSTFKKDVRYWGLEAKGPFRCKEAKFFGDGPAIMRSLKVDDIVDVRGAVFNREANFAYSQVGDISCSDAAFHAEARFDFMRIKGYADLSGTTFEGPVKFDNSYIGAGLWLDGTYFDSEQTSTDKESDCLIDMTNLVIQGTLTFKPEKWPSQGVRHSGIEFARWASKNGGACQFLKGADYDPQVYTNLENILRATGRGKEADCVGMANKSKERSSLTWIDAAYWWSLLLYLFVGNGYRPGWALIWSIGIVLFGILLFQKRHMIPQTGDSESPPSARESNYAYPRYSAIWYSLDLFVPAIALDMAQFWTPAPNRPFLLFWMRVQRTLGWIIVPIGLIAISGIVRP